MTDAAPAPSGWSALPRWTRLGLIVLIAVVVALVAIVAVRLVSRVPVIPLGVTAAADLRPGSCLAEDDRALDEYTVVDCGQAHPVQVFATADVELDETVYAQTGGVLDAFADAVCDRYREYRLFLDPQIDKDDFEARAIVVPSPEQYEAGDTEALCVIATDSGQPLTTDLYRVMP